MPPPPQQQPNGGKGTSNMAMDVEAKRLLNLTVLQHLDPVVEDILITAAHVPLYDFNIDLNPVGVYLDGTAMLIFGMDLYGLISNASTDVPSESGHALSGLSLFGMFALKVGVIHGDLGALQEDLQSGHAPVHQLL